MLTLGRAVHGSLSAGAIRFGSYAGANALCRDVSLLNLSLSLRTILMRWPQLFQFIHFLNEPDLHRDVVVQAGGVKPPIQIAGSWKPSRKMMTTALCEIIAS